MKTVHMILAEVKSCVREARVSERSKLEGQLQAHQEEARAAQEKLKALAEKKDSELKVI